VVNGSDKGRSTEAEVEVETELSLDLGRGDDVEGVPIMECKIHRLQGRVLGGGGT